MNDISIWNNIADHYDRHTYQEEDGAYPANRYRADRILDFLKTLPASKILDAGCGTGYVTERVAKLGGPVTALDASDKMLAVARSKPGNQSVTFIQGSVTKMELADQSFDVVMMNGVLPYLSKEEEPAAYGEVRRLLKDDGYFIAAQYNQLFDWLELDRSTVESLAMLTEQPSTEIIGERLAKLVPSIQRGEPRTMKVENPLTYQAKLEQFGFRERQRHYYNFHLLPPSLETPADNDNRAKLELAHHAGWQGVILARAFFVIAQKIPN